ncbi:MAG: GNAT family N-acetyltransferase [Pararhodobacter sp.]
MIRPALPTDLPQLLPMVHALAAHHGDPAACTLEALERDLFGPGAFISVLIAPGGYVALAPHPQLHAGIRGCELHHLFVRPDHRGTGLGGALVQAARDHAAAEGARYLMLGTHPDNHAAQAFWQAQGFEPHAPGPRFRLKF